MDINDIKLFIPTKNRLDKPKTYTILKELGLNPILVIEPQEESKAIELGFNYLLLDDNDRGITYARNFILNHARKNKYDFIVMMDDDIDYFKRVFPDIHKGVKDNTAFIDALKYFLKAKNCGTMQYSQFGWCQNKDVVYNKSLEVVHFLYMPQLERINYTENTVEDKDFALQLIFAGYKPFMLNWYCFQVPSIGTNKGGLYDLYNSGKTAIWAQNFLDKWGPDITKVFREKNGRINIKINWNVVKKILDSKYQQKLF